MQQRTASFWIDKLNLLPHPEGGFYKETYRAEDQMIFEGFSGERSLATGIFFLLEAGNFSALHRIKSDEMWHFYGGESLEIIEIDAKEQLKTTLLGNQPENGELLQYTVKAGNWFGSRPAKKSNYSLVGCTVWPGFDFHDFEMPNQEVMLSLFPQHHEMVLQMTRR